MVDCAQPPEYDGRLRNLNGTTGSLPMFVARQRSNATFVVSDEIAQRAQKHSRSPSSLCMAAEHDRKKTQMSDNDASMRSDRPKANSFLRRCWWTVPLGIACGLVAAYGVLRSFEPTYKASHYLKANHDYIIDESAVDRSPSQLATERRLVHSELVLAPVLMDPGLREAPSLSEPETAERNLRENLAFESDHDPALLIISYTDTDRKAAADVCNAVAHSYLRLRSDYDRRRYANLIQMLDPEIERWKRTAEEQTMNVARIRKEMTGDVGHAGIDPRKLDMDMAAELQRKIFETEIDLEVQKNLLAEDVASEVRSQTPLAGDESPSEVQIDRETQRLELKLAILNRKYDSLKKRLREADVNSIALEFASADLSRSRDLLHRLEDRAASVRLESKRGNSVISIVKATPPKMPVNPIPYHQIALAGGIGFLIHSFLASCWGAVALGPRTNRSPSYLH